MRSTRPHAAVSVDASAFAGDPVFNRQDAVLGIIEDLLIDVQRGTVAYAVLAPEGFLGLGDRPFAIPWSAFTLDVDRQCFILDADRQRLEEAPGFDRDAWSAIGDLGWAHDVHHYFGVRPYWQEAPA